MDAAANSYRRFLDGDESAFEEIMQELFCALAMRYDFSPQGLLKETEIR